MANNKVNFLRGTSTEYATSTKDNDTFYYTTDDEKLYLGGTEITGIEIDDTSTTATDKTWSAKKISDSIPTTLPANGGNADTVGNLSVVELVRNLGRVTDAAFLNNSEFNEYSYEADIEPTTAEAIGLPAGWYIIKGFRYYGTGKYTVQIAYRRNSANQAMTRYANGTDWTEWRGLGDGCNAASVGGKTITVTDVDPGAGSALNTGALVFVTEVT